MRSSHGVRVARSAIHSSSFHSYDERNTTLALAGGQLGGGGERVGLEAHRPVGPHDLVLVALPGHDAGHEQLPHPGAAQRTQGVDPAVPPVPVADDPHEAGGGRPHGERRALHALVDAVVGAQHRPQPVVAALADEVEVELAERRPQGPRLHGRQLAAALPPVGDLVVGLDPARRPRPRRRRRRAPGSSWCRPPRPRWRRAARRARPCARRPRGRRGRGGGRPACRRRAGPGRRARRSRSCPS